MSETVRNDLEIKELLSRIDKQREEALKLAAEQHKLTAEARLADREADKVADERLKLAAEAAKLNRDRWLAPWLVAFGVAGGALTVAQAVLGLLRALGHG